MSRKFYISGRWGTCADRFATFSAWPCPAGSQPFPSYRGYDYLGAALAARGFVVVSISVDAINMTSFDYGDRARLINEHLRLWQQLAVGLAPVKFDDPEGDHSDTLITTLPFTVVTGSCDGATGEDGQQYLDDVTGRNKTTDYSVSLHAAPLTTR